MTAISPAAEADRRSPDRAARAGLRDELQRQRPERRRRLGRRRLDDRGDGRACAAGRDQHRHARHRRGLRPPRDRGRRDRRAGAQRPRGRDASPPGRSASSARPRASARSPRSSSDYPDVPLVALPAEPGLGRGGRAAGVPRGVPRARAAADRGAGRQPPDAHRLPAARLGRRAAAVVARDRHRRQQARRALRAGHERAAARPVPRQRARHRRRARSPARSSSASRPPSSAPARPSRPALAALLATGVELHAAVGEALAFLDQALDAGFRPGMGNVIPDRFFWALPEEGEEEGGEPAEADAAARPTPPRRATRAMSTDARHAGAGNNAALFERARARHPGRRQLAGARLSRRRRHAALHRPRRGRVPVRRRGQALHRLHRLLGADDPRPPPPGGARRRCTAAVDEGLSFGAPTEREIELAEEILRHVPSMEQLRLVELGHRGGDERAAAGARRHRAQRDRQVRGLLPRPRRRPARQGRLGPGDLRPSDQRRRARRRSSSTRSSSNTTTSPQLDEAFALHGATIACVDDRADRRQHELRARRAALHAAPARAVQPRTARCSCSTR